MDSVKNLPDGVTIAPIRVTSIHIGEHRTTPVEYQTFKWFENDAYTEYRVTFTCSDNTTRTNWLRYSDLLAFKKRLVKKYENVPRLSSEIKHLDDSFPGKKWFNNTSSDVIEQRKQDLQEWFGKLTKDRRRLRTSTLGSIFPWTD